MDLAGGVYVGCPLGESGGEGGGRGLRASKEGYTSWRRWCRACRAVVAVRCQECGFPCLVQPYWFSSKGSSSMPFWPPVARTVRPGEQGGGGELGPLSTTARVRDQGCRSRGGGREFWPLARRASTASVPTYVGQMRGAVCAPGSATPPPIVASSAKRSLSRGLRKPPVRVYLPALGTQRRQGCRRPRCLHDLGWPPQGSRARRQGACTPPWLLFWWPASPRRKESRSAALQAGLLHEKPPRPMRSWTQKA